jgi:hypothetical protein
MALPVRANPVDVLVPLLLLGGGLWLATRVAGTTAGATPGGPGAVATPGGRDEWWNPSDPIYGPDAPAVWLKLLDAKNMRVYARAARLFRADASLVPTGEVLFLSPEAIAPLLGGQFAMLGYDWVARVGMVNNGDGTLTDQVFGLRIGIDRLYNGLDDRPGVVV